MDDINIIINYVIVNFQLQYLIQIKYKIESGSICIYSIHLIYVVIRALAVIAVLNYTSAEAVS